MRKYSRKAFRSRDAALNDVPTGTGKKPAGRRNMYMDGS
jgi:hypothetical protein